MPANWGDVVAASHFDGTNGATAIVDLKGGAPSAFGNAQISTAESAFAGGSSLLLDGSGDYVSFPYIAGFDLGAGDFGISIHAKQSSTSGFQCIFSRWTGGTQILLAMSGGAPVLYLNGGVVISGAGLTAAWHHFEIDRVGTNVYLFVDGVQVGSTYNIGTTALAAPTCPLSIGATEGNRDWFNGYVDDFRWAKGAFFHAAGFAAPTAPFTTPTVSGVVRDASGNPAARKVRVYDELTGAMVAETMSSAITGAFSTYGLDTPVCVIALDPSENAVIAAHVVST